MTVTTNEKIIAAALPTRAAGLLTKSAVYGVAEKAISQAIAAKRVYPALAADFGEQLGIELPLKTRDFVRVITHILAASEKPLKGAISKRKSEIVGILAELVAALTDTAPISLPAWALPKVREKKAEAEAVDVSGALDRANAEAEALASVAAEAAEATKTEAKADTALAKAVALIVANVGDLSEDQRAMLAQALALSEPALM